MLAPQSVHANSAGWIRVALYCLALVVAVFVACGDDPALTPAATFLISQATPTSIDDYRRLAEEDPAGRDSMFEKAVEALSADIANDPTNVDARVERGAVYAAMYRYSGLTSNRDEGIAEKALDDFSSAIDLEPNNVEAFIGRGNTHNSKQEREEANEDYQTALELLNESIYLHPNDVEAYMLRAQVHLSTREPDKAIQDLDAAVRLDPGNSLIYTLAVLRTRRKARAKGRSRILAWSFFSIQTSLMPTIFEDSCTVARGHMKRHLKTSTRRSA